MGLCNTAGAADDGRHSNSLEYTSLGAKGDNIGPIGPCQFHHQIFDRVFVHGFQSLDLSDHLGIDVCIGVNRAHGGQQGVFDIGVDFILHIGEI